VGAEHATAEKVNAPAEVREQELPQDDQATPEEARVLALQRKVGNRAVTALLRGTASVQRDITTRVTDLEAVRSWRDRVRTSFAADTMSMIIDAVHDFRAARDPKQKLYLARVIEWRTDDWLQRHGARTASKERRQKVVIEQLNAEAKREVGVLRAQGQYMRDMQGARLMEGEAGFEGLYGPGKKSGVYGEKAAGLAAGHTPGGQGADEAAAEIVKKYRLTAAEITAIRTFTLPDYAYINPATANADKWLRDNVATTEHLKGFGATQTPPGVDPMLKRSLAQSGDDALGPGLKLLKNEGVVHAGMLAQAAAKLPVYDKIAFRGRRMSHRDFATKYNMNAGRVEKFTSFSSMSKSEAVAQGYADGTAGDVKAKPNETISVLYEVKMSNGRDISALSAALSRDEQEVLVLPGAVFRVMNVSFLPPGNVGKPNAVKWVRITLVQLQ
jgi:hypothetical protein